MAAKGIRLSAVFDGLKLIIIAIYVGEKTKKIVALQFRQRGSPRVNSGKRRLRVQAFAVVASRACVVYLQAV